MTFQLLPITIMSGLILSIFSTIAIADSPTLYVNPKLGNDSNSGQSEGNPLQTITKAVQKAQPGTTIILAPGQYSNGEKFPLILEGITIKGNENEKGQGITIIGGEDEGEGNDYISRTFGGQNVTIVAGENSGVFGVTVTNPYTRGTGIWTEEGHAIIRNNTFINNKLDGVFMAGNAAPQVENNLFQNNDAEGISVTGTAKGEIRENIFDHTGYGLYLCQKSSPLIENNQIRSNHTGIIIYDNASPLLRGNSYEHNIYNDIVIKDKAKPDIQDRNLEKPLKPVL